MIGTNIIRRANPGDVKALTALCRKTFMDTYQADNTPENMLDYIDSHFTEEVLTTELADVSTEIFVSEVNEQLIGYIILRRNNPPTPIKSGNSMEIARFYVDQEFQGQKAGSLLMDAAFKWMEAQRINSVWLSVWQKNSKAISIYDHLGFEIVGETTFVLGNDVQFDHVMMKKL